MIKLKLFKYTFFKKNQYIFLLTFIFILITLLFLIFNRFASSVPSSNSTYGKNQIEPYNEKLDILIVVSRFNEDLEWLKEEPFKDYPVLIYNKGINDDFYKPINLVQIIPLNNIGREGHTYLYHIINYYEKLNNITVFLTGSNDLPNRKDRSKRMIQEIETNNSAVFISTKFDDVKKDLYSFKLDHYEATHQKNADLSKQQKLEPSTIRPFGKWFDTIFGNIIIKNVSFGGIFSISKKDILQHPKSRYEKLIKEFTNHPNPEVGHYFERSWEAVFYPMNNTIFIE